jgi:hypothetical protein
MADYSRPFDEAAAARRRDKYEKAEREAWRTGFRYFNKDTNASGFTTSVTHTECLACGCLIANQDTHRTTCAWTPKVPKTIYVDPSDA